MWVSPETKDPVLLHHPTRQSVRYFGAVRLRDGKFIFQRQEDPFNGDTFFAFLKKLRQARCHAGRRVVVALDNVSMPVCIKSGVTRPPRVLRCSSFLRTAGVELH